MSNTQRNLQVHHKGYSWELDPRVGTVAVTKYRGKEACVLLVKVKSKIDDRIQAINKKNNIMATRSVNGLERVYEFLFPPMDLDELVTLGGWYYQTGLVEYAEPRLFQSIGPQMPPLPNDPLFGQQWILGNTGQNNGTPGLDPKITEALEWISVRGLPFDEDIRIAVLDEGVQIEHEDLQPTLFRTGFSMFGTQNNPRPIQTDHHGTMVTGVIAGIVNNGRGIAGINPFCKIIPGRIYYNPNGVRATEISKGIRKAVDSGARILNLSWKMQPSPMVADAIDYASSKNCLVCAAAGNYLNANDDKSVTFPGNLDTVITVAAHDHLGRWINLGNTPREYRYGSCYGREVDISAPGIYIPTLKNGRGQYDEGFFGTSAATAIVSAIAGLVWSVNPALTADEVRYILFSSSDQVLDEGSEMDKFERYGHGRINALKAVKMAIGFVSVPD